MTKQSMRELSRLIRQERQDGTLTPHDAMRKAELLNALFQPAIQRGLEAARPQIAAAAAAMQQAKQKRADHARISEWQKRQAAALRNLTRSQNQRRR